MPIAPAVPCSTHPRSERLQPAQRRAQAPRRPPLRMRGIWAVFHPGEIASCPNCRKGFIAVHLGPGRTEVMVRVRPDPWDGVRAHLTHRCSRCRTALDVVVVDVVITQGEA